VFATLAALSPASLDVEVLCWFETRDFDEFRLLRQEALLGIMRIIEEAETSVAPTHIVHVAAPKGEKPTD